MEKGSARGKRSKVNIHGDYWSSPRTGPSTSLSPIPSPANETPIGSPEVDIIPNSRRPPGIKASKRKGKATTHQNLFGDTEELGRRLEALRSEGPLNREIGKEYCQFRRKELEHKKMAQAFKQGKLNLKRTEHIIQLLSVDKSRMT